MKNEEVKTDIPGWVYSVPESSSAPLRLRARMSAPRIVAEGLGIERDQDRGLVLIAQDIERSRLEDEVSARLCGEIQPAGDEHTQDMAVGKEHGILVQGAQACDHAVTAGRHLVGGLAAGGGRVKDRPSRFRLADLLGSDPLVLTVVPLGEVVGDLGMVKVTRQLAGAPRPLTGTTEHEFEIPSGEFALQCRSLTLSLQSQRNVGKGSVLAVLAPFGFTVTDKDDLGAGGAHGGRNNEE